MKRKALLAIVSIFVVPLLLLSCAETSATSAENTLIQMTVPEDFSLPKGTSDTDGLKLYVQWAAAKQGREPSQLSDAELNKLLTSYLVWRKNEALRRQDQMTEDLIAGAREESNME